MKKLFLVTLFCLTGSAFACEPEFVAHESNAVALESKAGNPEEKLSALNVSAKTALAAGIGFVSARVTRRIIFAVWKSSFKNTGSARIAKKLLIIAGYTLQLALSSKLIKETLGEPYIVAGFAGGFVDPQDLRAMRDFLMLL
ncbi:MAG: hypothetical protein P4L31_00255 [Candidatus Babeliales bacterium]|nr:hypothetical protein [Candidatus Babeliales bacterium]